MACTALQITKSDGTIVRMKFMTVPNPEHTDVDVYVCNEQFIPTEEPVMTTNLMDEETYHKKLRLEASERNQFIPEESTDRHWNPDYIEPPEENGNQDTV